MGSFNTACFISGAPIRENSKVKLFFIQATGTGTGSICHPHDTYTPISYPIDAKYTDYNTYAYDENDPNFQIVLEYLKGKVVEMEQGPNTYHDDPVKRDNLTRETIADAIHNDRLRVSSVFGDEAEVVMVAVLESVYNNILTVDGIEDWRGDVISAERVLANMRADYADSLKRVQGAMEEWDGEGKTEQERAIFEHKIKAMTAMTMRDSFRTEGILRPLPLRVDLLDDAEAAERFFKNESEYLMLSHMLYTLNKAWHPMVLAGQDIDYLKVKKYHEVIMKSCQQMEDEWNEECG